MGGGSSRRSSSLRMGACPYPRCQGLRLPPVVLPALALGKARPESALRTRHRGVGGPNCSSWPQIDEPPPERASLAGRGEHKDQPFIGAPGRSPTVADSDVRPTCGAKAEVTAEAKSSVSSLARLGQAVARRRLRKMTNPESTDSLSLAFFGCTRHRLHESGVVDCVCKARCAIGACTHIVDKVRVHLSDVDRCTQQPTGHRGLLRWFKYDV
jgi:hypothetical protein